MRYNGSKYGNSEWSNTVVINTLEVDEKIISFWNSYENTLFQPLKFGNGDILYTYKENTTEDLILVLLDLKLNIISCKLLNNYTGNGNGIITNNDKIIVSGTAKSNLGGGTTSFILEMDQNLNVLKSLKGTNTLSNYIGTITLYNNTLLLDYTIRYYAELTNQTVKNLVQLDSKLDSTNTLLEPVEFTWTTINPITPVIAIIVNTTFNPTSTNHTLTIENNTPLFDIKDL